MIPEAPPLTMNEAEAAMSGGVRRMVILQDSPPGHAEWMQHSCFLFSENAKRWADL